MEFLKIYLSASISNSPNNAHVAGLLPQEQFFMHLPQLIVPDQLNHTEFPLHVYQQCIEMMEDSQIGLVMLDAFGRDCAWECGWYAARPEKCLIAYVQSSSLFLRDWMVKGGLDALITTNPRLYATAQNNPILATKPLYLIEDETGLPEALQTAYLGWKTAKNSPE
jgi:nucleoside 2-deoxyribosyltransferase